MPRLEGGIDFFKSGTWLMQFLVLLLRNTVATRWIFVVNSLASCGSMVATHRGGLSAYPLRIRRILNDFVAIKNGTLGRFVSQAAIGKTSWQTSVFRDSKSQCYLLPIKASVRTLEGLKENCSYEVSVTVGQRE